MVIYIFFIFLFFSNFSSVTYTNNKTNKIVQISIPKCGTFLLRKCIFLLTGKQDIFTYDFRDNNLEQIAKTHNFRTHLRYTDYNKKMLTNKNFTIFFIYRDPRDQLISYIFWGKKNLENELFWLKEKINPTYDPLKDKTKPFVPKLPNYLAYENLSMNETIFKLINLGSPYYDVMGPYLSPKHETKGINEFYHSYLPWMNTKGVCSIKFENLIGSKGGGNDKLQLNEIRKIAKHIGINITDKEATKVAHKLFGGTTTFKDGQIGSWKNHFNAEHKIIFKKTAGKLLIKLDYEKDMNW